MSVDWSDLRLFLDVARLGGLSAAAKTTGLSAATLGRRVTALEKQIGEPLFYRSHSGYALTRAGEDLLERAEDVEAAMTSLTRWRDGTLGERVVRIAAGTWTSEFLARNIGELWSAASDPFRIEFVTAYEKVDIGRRNADIGVRSARPTEPNLAGRLSGKVAHAIYSGRQLVNGVEAGLFVGLTGDGANLQTTRWLMAHHGDRVGLRGNDMHSVRELVAAGGGLTVLPCFAGDSDKRLVQVAPPIAELLQEQWLVSHHDERHSREVRIVLDRLGELFHRHAPLFNGAVETRLNGLLTLRWEHFHPGMHVVEGPSLNASAFVVGARDGAGAALMDFARSLEFTPVQRYGGLARAEKQADETPLLFFLCAAVPDVRSLKPMADAIRFSLNPRLRYSPLIYFARELSVDGTKLCIKMGFDDVIALPYSGDIAERIKRQIGHIQTYYETATYFGPDRRNRAGNLRSIDSDHGGGQFRRIEIVRSPDTGVNVLRDDFQVVV